MSSSSNISKSDEILNCLRGHHNPHAHNDDDDDSTDNGVVDLWHLRQLALTRGGLVSSDLRKVAWPKLLNIPTQVLLCTTTSTTTGSNAAADDDADEGNEGIEVTLVDMELLQDEISQPTVYNIENAVWTATTTTVTTTAKARHHCQNDDNDNLLHAQDEYYSSSSASSSSSSSSSSSPMSPSSSLSPPKSSFSNSSTNKGRRKQVTFATPPSSPLPPEDEEEVDAAADGSESLSTNTNNDDEDKEQQQQEEESTSLLLTTTTDATNVNQRSQQLLQPPTSPSASSLPLPRSLQEQVALTNTLVSLLRCTPPPMPSLPSPPSSSLSLSSSLLAATEAVHDDDDNKDNDDDVSVATATTTTTTNTTTSFVVRQQQQQQQCQSRRSRYRYYSGLHNLASVLLINLQGRSPSLCSLMLRQLATYHLRPYLLRPNDRRHRSSYHNNIINNDDVIASTTTTMTTTTMTTTRDTMFVLTKTLLHKLLFVVNNHGSNKVLHTTDDDDDVVVNMVAHVIMDNWIPSWFCSSSSSHILTNNVHVVSRFIDVFLVSHVTMPIYLSVALFSHYFDRAQRLVTATTTMTTTTTAPTTEESTNPSRVLEMEQVMMAIPKLLSNEEDEMAVVEDIIATAIHYMQVYPPQSLLLVVSDAENPDHEETTPAMLDHEGGASLPTPPTWMLASTAPTDWTLLQRAKTMRQQQQKQTANVLIDDAFKCSGAKCAKSSTALMQDIWHNQSKRHGLAVAALGLSPTTTTRRCRRKPKAVVAMLVLTTLVAVLAVAATIGRHSQGLDFVTTTSLSPSLLSSWQMTMTTSSSSEGYSSKHQQRRLTKKAGKSRRRRRRKNTLPEPSAQPKALSRHLASFTGTAPQQDSPLARNKWRSIQHWMRQQRLLTKQSFSNMAREAIVESDKLRWKGQRFLI